MIEPVAEASRLGRTKIEKEGNVLRGSTREYFFQTDATRKHISAYKPAPTKLLKIQRLASLFS
jgi:hypothetical protein